MAFIGVSLLSSFIFSYSLRRLDANIQPPRFLWWITAGFIVAGCLKSQQAVEKSKKEIEYYLTDIVPIIADEFEQLGHDKITTQTPADDPLYLKLIEVQKRILKATPGINDVYTLRRLTDGRIALTVDSETDYNHNGVYDEPREQRTPIGKIYDHEDEEMNHAFKGQKGFDTIPYHDEWGNWVTAYAPLRGPDGKVDAVLGVDYAAEDWLKAIQQARLTTFLEFYILIIIAWFGVGLFKNYKSKVAKEAELKIRAHHELIKATRLEGLVTMSAGVAHDLKNALTPLTMGLDELRKGQPAQPAMVDALDGSVRRGLQIVRQLEGFAKGIKGEHVLLKPYYILKDLQPILTATYPKNIVIFPRFDTQLDPISGDPGQLQEALLSLCGNARDAMPDGGNLRLEAENRQLAAGAITPESPAGAYVVVRVGDNGSGIAEQHKSRIFDPYFTTKSRQQASGLGLPSARAIITAHRGFIKFQSAAGKGSDFEVFLPALASEAGNAEPPAEPAADRIAHGSLVLLISQDLEVWEMISANLKLLGHAVTRAADDTDALVVITEQPQHIGLVLIDQNLPGQDGGGLIRVIRKMLPTATVIALSNRAQDTLKPEFKNQDVAGLWLRPFTKAQFEKAGFGKYKKL